MIKKSDNDSDEAGEKRLAELIKEAGDDVRMSNKKAREQHYAKLKRVIKEAALKQQDFIAQ